MESYPQLLSALWGLLVSIPEKKIVAVEAGYGGTFLLKLMAPDKRVDFRMFTTAPYLFYTYAGKIFCNRYDDIRKFETLYARDALLKFAAFSEIAGLMKQKSPVYTGLFYFELQKTISFAIPVLLHSLLRSIP